MERRRQQASEFVDAHLEPGESVVALLPWSVYYPPEELTAAERVQRRTSVAAAAKAGAGQPRGLAVTDRRMLVFDYPPPQDPGKGAATLAKSIFKARSLKRGLAEVEEPPERLDAAYPRADVPVREWTEGGKLNRELELQLPGGESLRLKIAKAHWEDAESVARALGHSPGSEQV
jgi:hypothetical protein